MIFKSPYPEIEIPEVSLTEFVLRRADELADHPALIDGPTGRTLTYGGLASAIHRMAGGLAERGFGKGDVMAISSPNSPEYAVAFHGAARIGGIVTTANPLYTSDELAKQLNDSGARFIVTVGAFLDRVLPAVEQSTVEEVFTFDGAPGTTPFAALLEADEYREEVPLDFDRDVVALPYSSGTTGVSKGVMLTHRNLVANMAQIDGCAEVVKPLDKNDCLAAILPFYHIFGLLVVMNYGISRGVKVVTLPRFDLEQFLQIIQDHGVTYSHLVPPVVLALAKHPVVDDYDLSTLRGVLSGAAPLGRDLASAVEARLGCVVRQGYGLTETSPVTHMAPNRVDLPADPASIGPCLPNTEVRIVDTATGEDLGVDQRGEVWIRGPQVMLGYLNKPDATRDCIDDEGWFQTGDIGYVNEGGHFYIVDRVKELIKYKGFQVAPAELEALLLSHPSIADAAVIPSPDEEAGEVPKAFVVPKGNISEEAIMDFVAERVAPHKKIRRLEIVDSIPKSPSGKILRRLLVERERATGREPPTANP